MSSPTWTIHQGAGAEVDGLNLNSISEDDLNDVMNKFAKHGVVFFRRAGGGGNSDQQTFSSAAHVALCERIGSINTNRFFLSLEHQGYPQVAVVEKKPEQGSAIGEKFHSDHTYDHAPALGSMLVARKLPETGGDTVFVDKQKSYATLPEDIKKRLVGLRAVHSSQHVFGKDAFGATDKKTGKSIYSRTEDALNDQQDTVRKFFCLVVCL